MPLALDDQWIWDFWLVRDEADWHIYFLKADKSLGDPELRHRNVTHGHAVSRDLVNWDYRGTCFAPSTGPAFDDWSTWTGSVVRDDAGLWHLFYTGTPHALEGMHQRIGHATSTDMHSWQRVGAGPALDISGPDYEEYTPGHWHDRAMRDPWVIRNPNGHGWLMFFTARVPGLEEPNAGGAIGFATSPDLMDWTLQPPVYRGGMFGQMEVPQVFEHRGKWYCVFCTAAGHWSQAYKRFNPQSPVTGTHYLMAEDPSGPWQVAPGGFLDGSYPCRRYAGKIVNKDGELFLMGFIQTRGDEPFVGSVSDPIPVTVDENGYLTAHPERAAPGADI